MLTARPGGPCPLHPPDERGVLATTFLRETPVAAASPFTQPLGDRDKPPEERLRPGCRADAYTLEGLCH